MFSADLEVEFLRATETRQFVRMKKKESSFFRFFFDSVNQSS